MREIRLVLQGAFALFALESPAWPQAHTLTIPNPSFNEGFGSRVAGLGDVNSDGVPDFAVGSPTFQSSTCHGLVRVYSGKTGEVMYSVEGPLPTSSFGSVAGPGDLNGDGVPDMAVGAETEGAASGTGLVGAVYFLSGADGSLLHKTTAPTPEYAGLGKFVWSIGDIDSDGIGDVLARSGAVPGKGYYVHVLSGKDGSLLQSQAGDPSLVDQFGWRATGLGDVDGDGYGDYLVAADANDTLAFDGGRVCAYSGRDGAVLWVRTGTLAQERLGIAVAGVGDTDCDGVPDVAVTHNFVVNQAGIGRPEILILSGADGSLLLGFMELEHWPKNSFWGSELERLGDMDGDGRGDLLVALPGVNRLKVHSGATGKHLATAWPHTQTSTWGFTLAALGDLNGDELPDFLGSGSGGVPVHVFLGGWPDSETYCTAKDNSAGCLPAIDWKGAASLTVGADMVIFANNVIPQQLGFFAWSRSTSVQPFFGGTLCLGSPIVRSIPLTTTGNEPCGGKIQFQFSKDYMRLEKLEAGTTIYAQFWYRDPLHLDGTGVGLSDAIAFPVVP